MDTDALKSLGFTESEISVYVTLIKNGALTVSEISEESGVHRTNIYTMLNKLENAGLASHTFEDGKKKYKSTDPDNLLNYLKETESRIGKTVEDLCKIRCDNREQVAVFFFKGVQGMKSALKDIAREGKDLYGLGISGKGRKYLTLFHPQVMRDIRKSGIKTKCIYIEGVKPAAFGDFEVKYLPKEFISPVYTWIYGDKVVFNIWEPSMTAIMIKSKEVADEYKKYFNLLWKIAKFKKS